MMIMNGAAARLAAPCPGTLELDVPPVLCTLFWQPVAAKMVPEFGSSRVTWMSFRGERPRGERRPRPGPLSGLRGAGALRLGHRARIGVRRRPARAGIDKIPGGCSGDQRQGANC